MATPEDIAASLTMEEIPVKLRCAACNKLASNAFRMPCCDQSICETCQSSLPQACPVCLHEPVKADDCRPNKALRTTIKVFLRKKGIEREAARKKELVDKAVPVTSITPHVDATRDAQPQDPIKSPVGGETAVEGTKSTGEVSHVPQSVHVSNIASTKQILSTQEQMDIPRPSIESVSEAQKAGLQDKGVGMNGVQGRVDQNLSELEQEQNNNQRLNQNQQWGAQNGVGSLMNNGGFGFDTTSGGFPNLGFNATGDFSQMMQFMPNGMQANSMGTFPNMMGMPGVGMDPMAMSQGMYGGFGAQGMGINGMNVGLGFNAGQGAFGGFNGQPAAWNTGQDKFNQNAYGSLSTGMAGDFGANAGYGGYSMPQHQGNFNQMHHQYQNNDFQNGYNGPGFHNRGRGRGRGYLNAGRGRGSFNQVNPGNQANYEPFHHQVPQQIAKQGSFQQQPAVEAGKAQELQPQSAEGAQNTNSEQVNEDKKADDQLSKELDPGDAADTADTITINPSDIPIIDKSDVVHDEPLESVSHHVEVDQKDPAPIPEQENKPAPIATFVSDDVKEPETSQVQSTKTASSSMMPPPAQVVPAGPAALYSHDQPQDYGSRGRGVGRGPYRGNTDFRGGLRGRGSGFLSNSIVVQPTPVHPTPAVDIPIIPPSEPKGLGVEGAPKAPKALRDGLPNTGIRGGRGFSIIGRASTTPQTRPNGQTRSRSPSPARSRSPPRHQSHRHRSYRHRSTSSSNDSERDRRHDRHRRHSRKHEDMGTGENHELNESRGKEKSADESSRKTSHRSHRDHEREKDIGRGSHRSHRSHRERSREREGDPRNGGKRSRSVEESKGSKRVEGSEPLNPTDNRRQEKQDESSPSLHKRRDREDEDRHRERKRSRRERSPEVEDRENNTRSRNSKREEPSTRPSRDQTSKTQESPAEVSKVLTPTKPEMDHHTMEREARNRERLLKELQRREAMEGKGSINTRRDSKSDNRSGTGARRVSYKYEDEESNEARASRVESEREAGRWR